MSYGLLKGKKEAGGDVVGRPQVRYQVVPLSPYPLHGGVLEWCVCVCVCVCVCFRSAVVEAKNVQK